MDTIVLPKMSQQMEQAKILKWLKKENDPVAPGDPLFEMETDKADLEVEAQVQGVLRKIIHGEGETVPVLSVIGYVGAADEPIPDNDASQPASVSEAKAPSTKSAPPKDAPAPTAGGRILASPAAKRLAAEKGIDLSALTGSGPSGRITTDDVDAFKPAAAAAPARKVKASPMASRRAKEMGIDLATITGTGPGGRITVDDVIAAPAGGQATDENIDLGVAGDVRPVEGVRKITAERLVQSKTTAPHYYLTVDIDMTQAVALRKRLVPNIQEANGSKLSYNDMIMKACAIALTEIPVANATWKGTEIHLLKEINIGIAVNLKRGLIVPVVKGADKLTLAELSAATDALVKKAQTKKLKPGEMSDGTFTISNLGAFGIDRFVAIINPPEAAILAVGAIKDQVIAIDGMLAVHPMMSTTLSLDHRIIDGAVGARFLARIKQLIEEATELK